MHGFKREVWEKLRLDKLWEIEATLANGTVIKRGVSGVLIELRGYGERHTGNIWKRAKMKFPRHCNAGNIRPSSRLSTQRNWIGAAIDEVACFYASSRRRDCSVP